MIVTETLLKHYHDFRVMVDAGALVVVNHSGGKDSQAIYAIIRSVVPADQIMVVHADLGDDVEWAGLQEHIIDNTEHKLTVAKAIWKDGRRKQLLEAIEARGKWPSSAARYCTSDMKRGPCNKVIRAEAERRGTKLVVSCFGFRAEESPARAKRATWQRNDRMSRAGRTWIEFSPIHDLTTEEVFSLIRVDGQVRHWAYDHGMERLSCCFCVLGSVSDLTLSARLNPDLYRRYVALEKRMGHTFRHNASLESITGVSAMRSEAA